jgi:hypothetical protein
MIHTAIHLFYQKNVIYFISRRIYNAYHLLTSILRLRHTFWERAGFESWDWWVDSSEYPQRNAK